MLRNIVLFPVASFLVGFLILAAVGQRPELVTHGRARTALGGVESGILARWRDERKSGNWSELAAKAQAMGIGKAELKAAGQRLGITGDQAKAALAGWAAAAPGSEVAAAAAALGDQAKEHRVLRVRALDVLAVTLVGMPAVLVGCVFLRQLKRLPARAAHG